MYELKTKVTEQSVLEFIEKVDNLKKREDAYQLLDIYSEATGLEAKMWGDSMIGFGSYHYKYASGHEFGKHTRGKGCVCVNKLSDIDTEVLKKLIILTLKSSRERYPE